MTKKRVLMILSNPYRPDPRVQREIDGLIDAGYSVSLIAWDRKAELEASELSNGFDIHRVQDIQTVYGAGWRQLFYLPRFWRKAVKIGLELKPDLVHCHDLDTLYAGWRIKRQLKCSLIYDAHEHYPALMSLYLPDLMVGALARWEQWLLGNVDATITASTVLKDEFETAGHSPVVILGNYPELESFVSTDETQVAAEQVRLAVGDAPLTVGYVGGFSRNRMLEPLLAAATLQPDIQFHLWGDGHQRELVQNGASALPNVTYHGWLEYSRLPVVIRALDVVYYGLCKDYPGAVYNAPNTLAQAMAAGRPVIATDVGDLGRMVRATECGVLLANPSPEAILEAIKKLRDVDLRNQLGNNGQQAAITKYNAAAMQDGLVALYEELWSDE
jgi:glycosyltransferase involved in cell wall biosynthesis